MPPIGPDRSGRKPDESGNPSKLPCFSRPSGESDRMATVAAKYVSLINAARKLGLPMAWLRREAGAGRVPVLRVGRRLLFNVEAVEVALLARTPGEAEGGENDRH